MTHRIGRRSFLAGSVAGSLLAPAGAQTPRDWTGASPVRYPDPDIVALEPRFAKYKIGNTPVRRLHTGMLWAEGPAWTLLPEICSNLCFGGAKRNRLFMTASQSLYAVYVEARGAHIA